MTHTLNECTLLPYHPERLDIWIGTECLWTPAIPQQSGLQDHLEDRLPGAVGSVEGGERRGACRGRMGWVIECCRRWEDEVK
jgi:hypothetical protein